jgi:ribosomal protein L18E
MAGTPSKEGWTDVSARLAYEPRRRASAVVSNIAEQALNGIPAFW